VSPWGVESSIEDTRGGDIIVALWRGSGHALMARRLRGCEQRAHALARAKRGCPEPFALWQANGQRATGFFFGKPGSLACHFLNCPVDSELSKLFSSGLAAFAGGPGGDGKSTRATKAENVEASKGAAALPISR
jgi:hypothetical protein